VRLVVSDIERSCLSGSLSFQFLLHRPPVERQWPLAPQSVLAPIFVVLFLVLDEHVRHLAAVARRGGNGCSHWREATSCRCSFFSPFLILSIRSALVRCSACVPMQGYATGSLGLVNLAERVAASCSVAPSRRWRWCPSCRPSPVLRYTLVVLFFFWSCQSRLLTAPRLRRSPSSAVGRES